MIASTLKQVISVWKFIYYNIYGKKKKSLLHYRIAQVYLSPKAVFTSEILC